MVGTSLRSGTCCHAARKWSTFRVRLLLMSETNQVVNLEPAGVRESESFWGKTVKGAKKRRSCAKMGKLDLE